MPGLKNERGSFMSAFKAYRLVTAADTDPASVTEKINAGAIVKEAKGNQLVAQIVVPATVTQYTIKVYGDAGEDITPPGGYPTNSTRWSIIDGLTGRTESSFITITNFPAVSNIKILITDVTGSLGAGAHILYSITP